MTNEQRAEFSEGLRTAVNKAMESYFADKKLSEKDELKISTFVFSQIAAQHAAMAIVFSQPDLKDKVEEAVFESYKQSVKIYIAPFEEMYNKGAENAPVDK